MPEVRSTTLAETRFEETLPSGLHVVVLPRPGYAKTFGMFTTRYGSIDHHFRPLDGQEIRVTDGIAHFLEHKLFEEPDGDAFTRFGRKGASANAFTGHTQTSYLFTATDHITENLHTLLDFVQAPYLTDANVAKEKGIIEQEIRMYDDHATWRGYRAMLENLYHVHPVRIDIAGTVESISQIDVESLLTCYRTFYHPANMVLVVCGDVDPDVVFREVRANQARKTFEPWPGVERLQDPEPDTVHAASTTLHLSVARPILRLGFKDRAPGIDGEALQFHHLVAGIALELTLGKASDLYNRLDGSGLIDATFSYDHEAEPGYAYTMLGGETDDPERLASALIEGFQQVRTHGFVAEAFERVRRKRLGEFLRVFNSPESLTYEFTTAYLAGVDMYAIPALLDRVTLEHVTERARALFDPERMSKVVILPTQES
jgi:predicted Zn-dependent peptidase